MGSSQDAVRIADPLAASALVNALDDRDGDVRWLAAEGLAALGENHCNLCCGTDRTGSIVFVLRGRTPRLSHFGQEEEARPDSAARADSPGQSSQKSRASGCV